MAKNEQEEQDDSTGGGIVICSGEFYDAIGTFSDQFEGAPGGKLREAARFAMAIGIQKDLREKKSDWKKKGKVRTIAHLHGQFDQHGRYSMESLFEMLDLIEEEDDTALNVLISEYITGGMRWLVENEMTRGENYSILIEEFPDLFSSEEELDEASTED
jgi:hypothetical protein